MKILIYSVFFYPSLGGTETFVDCLASELLRLGHEVKVLTDSQGEDNKAYLYEVIRRPSNLTFFKCVKWADFFLNLHPERKKISWLAPLLLGRPWCINTHIEWNYKDFSWQQKAIGWLLRNVPQIVPSKYMQQISKFKAIVIQDPCDFEVFKILPGISRAKDLIFVGRIVQEKGLRTLIQAIKILADRGEHYQLTVVGDGDDVLATKKMIADFNIQEKIDFVGWKQKLELVQILNEHKIIVIPSIWNEPFGLVALEGIA
jgi:glycosyltransferase involved in cell wall biosynthesis